MSACPPSTFCDRCNAVLLDDSRMGGFAARGVDGQDILKLSEDAVMQELPIDFILAEPYPDLPYLSKSAEAGCKFCEFLRTTALRQAIEVAAEEDYDIIEIEIRLKYIWWANAVGFIDDRGLRTLNIDFRLHDRTGTILGLRRSYSVESVLGPCASWLRLGINEPGYVLGPTTVSWIQEKLESSSYQPEIDELSDKIFMPTRLVRVDCTPARLIETSNGVGRGDEGGSFKYAALTYCWGPPEQAKSQLKTERQSLSSRLSSIDERDMTKVLQDAIQTCRALSIPYLWVDALCIIQDDPKDWERESALLGKIFFNAYLTICALSSESCNEGFLNRQPAQVEIPFRSKLRPEIQGAYSLRSRGPKGAAYSDLAADLLGTKWDSRGWTYQETIMSSRILSFGHSKIHFMTAEDHQTQGEQAISPGFRLQVAELRYDIDHAVEDFYRSWHDSVVAGYSDRLLTYKKDRFPALSGVAQHFSKLLKDEYIAGLWKHDLHRGLFWVCLHETPQNLAILLGKLSASSAYVSPSWSWASRQGYVEFGSMSFGVYASTRYKDHRREYRRVESNIVLEGIDKFGQIREGSLTITTKIRPLPADMYSYEDDKWNSVYIGKSEVPCAHCDLDWRPRFPIEPRRELMMLLLGSAVDTGRYSPDTEDQRNPLLNADGETNTGPAEDIRCAYGLLIHPLFGTDKFFRVGIFYSSSSDGWGTRLFSDCPEETVVLI
ncbi:HET-domain-containing protein [Hypoxylon sp. FL0543]|nr:HET-domain-containing protein [Hypoxylon sp. FL0543]